ncbi:MAG: EF-P lysine aminoacylase GenX [Bdellovibrionales bacterium]|nr:EF-P lysine aminoacylase GenX [Bdellovibrionales bacterium]
MYLGLCFGELSNEIGTVWAVSVMKKMLREEFLENKWKSYPIFDANSENWGRFYSWLSESDLELLSYRSDEFHQLKKMVIKNTEEINLWKEVLQKGDLISINSHSQITLLSPNLSDSEYTDFVPLNQWAYLQLWAEYIRLVRLFFNKNNFLEVSTSLIVSHPGSEPTLDPFKIKLKSGKQVKDKYLPTSPELNLKKVLTTGVPKIFEITKSFRNNERSERHCPEFWILEWYRNFSDLKSIKKDVQELILFLQENLVKYLNGKSNSSFSLDLSKVKLNQEKVFSSISFKDFLFQKYQFHFEPTTTYQELENFCKKQGVQYLGLSSMEDLFSVLVMETIESKLDPNQITCLEKYPPYAAALARTDSSGWAERFEVYWQGLEIANAFFELNDPTEQKKRFEIDNQLKLKNNLEEIQIDEDFLFKLNQGLPPCSGIALGLERLFMALFGITNIHDLKIKS